MVSYYLCIYTIFNLKIDVYKRQGQGHRYTMGIDGYRNGQFVPNTWSAEEEEAEGEYKERHGKIIMSGDKMFKGLRRKIVTENHTIRK